MVIGWARGGRVEALGQASLRGVPVLGAALVLVVLPRVVPVPPIGDRVMQAGGYLAALVVLWQNRAYAWTVLIFAGLGLNSLVIVLNGGRMPITEAALLQVARVADLEIAVASLDPRHVVVGPGTRLVGLGDIVPLRLNDFGMVLSPGDVLMAVGLAGFVQGQMRAARAGPASGS